MTLNQVVRRIRQLALDHKQVRNFYQGELTDFLADRTTLYPSVFMQNTGGKLSTTTKDLSLSYRLYFLDLVHVANDTLDNEQDVQSDMLQIMMDLLAQMFFPAFDDWIISPDNQVQIYIQYENDLTAGCSIDFSIRTRFTQNICQVPTIFDDYQPTDPTMKELFDFSYTATGTEGISLTIDALKGKKILWVTRDNAILYPVSNNPASTEFTFDGTVIGISIPLIAGNKLLILYRNY